MGSSKSIAKGVAWTTIVNLVNGVYGFISVPVLIAYFGKSDYGLIGLAMSVNVYLRLMDLGFSSTNIRFFSNWLAKKDYANVNGLFRTSLSFYGTLGFLNAIILLIISFFSNSIFNVSPEQDVVVKHLFYILSISAFISWYTSCFDQLVKANELVGWTQKMTLLPRFLQIIILILTVTIGFSIEWYYALTAFSLFLILPFMVRKIKLLCPYVSFVPSFDKKVFKEILPYSLNIFSFGLFQFSVVNLRSVFLGIESTPDSITDYRILDGIVRIVMMLGGAFMGVFLPSASKVVAMHNQAAQNQIAYQGTKFITIAICFCCFGMMSVSSEMLTVYVGKDYLNLTIWLDLWLLSTLATHNQAISSLILAGSDIRAITYSTIVASIVGLLLTWVLIPIYDVGATVIGYFVYCLIQLLFYYIYYWPRVMGINSYRVFFFSFMPYMIIGVIISLCLKQWVIEYQNEWLPIIIKGSIFCISFVLMTYLLLGEEDKLFLRRLLNKS